MNVNPLYKDLEERVKRLEASFRRVFVKLTDPALSCTNETCQCKERKKENEGLEVQQIDLNDYEVVPGSQCEISMTPRGNIHIRETVRKKRA